MMKVGLIHPNWWPRKKSTTRGRWLLARGNLGADDHPQPYWLLRAYCLVRKAERLFALKDIKEWKEN